MTNAKIRLASYNIRKARGLDQRRRPERTLAVINALEADVVVLQEADRRMGERVPAVPRAMIEAETDFKLVEVSANGISLGHHGNAVLVRDPAQVRAIHRIDMPGFEPRGALRIDLELGGGVSIVAAHLGLRRRDRRVQLAHLRKQTEGCAQVVIAGDFNEWAQHRGLEPLADRFVIHSPGHSFHARRPIAGLDRFALSADVTLGDAGVAQDALARIASDHLPIWSDLEFAAAS